MVILQLDMLECLPLFKHKKFLMSVKVPLTLTIENNKNMQKTTTHYVNNKDLLQALLDYKKTCRSAKRNKLDKPRIPEYIGRAIFEIARRYATKSKFVNYMFVDEMISDAVENCISKGVDNFDAKITQNPFAYFTQIIHFAFIRKIQKEKKHLYIKYKVMMDSSVNGISSDDYDHLQEIDKSYTDNEYMTDLVTRFEKSVQEKRIKIKQMKKQAAKKPAKKAKKSSKKSKL